MSELDRSIEIGCSTLVRAMLDLEKLKGEHGEIEFAFEFGNIDYKITLVRIGRTSRQGGSKAP